jgi:spore maturation protein SpmB
MPIQSDRALGRYRRWYSRLLRLYPRPFRERFAEPMTQTFTDLARERSIANRPLFGFVAATFLGTLGNIIKENFVRIDRPSIITVLAILVAVAGVGAVLSVLAGAAIHGLGSLNEAEALIVLGALALGVLCLTVAYGAWSLKPWAWTLGVVVGTTTIVYMIAVLIRGWADLMIDAPPLAGIGLLVVVTAVVGLFIWFRPEVKAAFGRA